MKRPNKTGFVLLEVMLSLVILVSGVVLVFQSYRASIKAFYESRERFEAGLLMESQIGEMERTGRLNTVSGTPSFLSPVSWNDETQLSDPTLGTEHHVSLLWGEGHHAGTLEQSIYVWP